MRARYYNPTIQRFVNVDPIRDGLNWYGYCNGDSINVIDPTGKITQNVKKSNEHPIIQSFDYYIKTPIEDKIVNSEVYRDFEDVYNYIIQKANEDTVRAYGY